MDFKGFPGLAGKTAIVTGSTQGWARTSRAGWPAGANVVLVGRNARPRRWPMSCASGRCTARPTSARTRRSSGASRPRWRPSAGSTSWSTTPASTPTRAWLPAASNGTRRWTPTWCRPRSSPSSVAPRLPRRREHGQHRWQVRRGRTRDLSGVGLAADHQELRGGTGAGRRAVLAVSPAWTWSPSVEQLAGGSRAAADAVGAHFHPLGRVGSGERSRRRCASPARTRRRG